MTAKTFNEIAESEDQTLRHRAIEWYVSGSGLWINQYLRGNEQLAPLLPIEKELLNGLDDATSQPLHGIDTLYRSVDAEVLLGKMTFSDYDALIRNLKKRSNARHLVRIVSDALGKTIVEKGFMSTTTNLNTALEWGALTGASKPLIIEFSVPEGITGADLTYHPINQQEVLLSRGQHYKIRDIIYKEENIYVYADLLGTRMAKTFNELLMEDIRKKNIYHDPKTGRFTFAPGNSYGLTKAQEKTLSELEPKICDLDHEEVYAIDRNGKIVASNVNGDSMSVDMSKEDLQKTTGNVVTHNHPSEYYNGDRVNYGGPLSIEDIYTSLSYDQNQIRAVAPEGTYTLTKTINAKKEEFIDYVLRKMPFAIEDGKYDSKVYEQSILKAKGKLNYEEEKEYYRIKYAPIDKWFTDNAGKFGYEYKVIKEKK